MALVETYIRRKEKQITGAGIIPTVPASSDHTDGTWVSTDLYEGELCFNITDKKLYSRFGSSIIKVGGEPQKGDLDWAYDDAAAIRALTGYESDSDVMRLDTLGIYQYDATKTTADDGVTYLKPTAVTGAGRWVLQKIAEEKLTFGIADTNVVAINSTSVANGEYARFTANGLESRSISELTSELPFTNYLPLSGGTLTGLLTLSGVPTADLHASTKKYVDDSVTTPLFARSGIIISNENGTYATDDFVFGDDQIGDTDKAQFSFRKSKGAFRAGAANSAEWSDANTGMYSVSLGYRGIARGDESFAVGTFSIASGYKSAVIGSNSIASGSCSAVLGASSNATKLYSIVVGNDCNATGESAIAVGSGLRSPSFSEIVVGSYNATYTPSPATGWSATDRLFTVGNGTGINTSRSNALTMLKSGFTGFGINIPTEVVDVVGNVNISGSYKIGSADINTAGTLSNVAYVNENTTFQNNLTIAGNLTVNGDKIIQNVEELKVTDNTILVNAGETGAGVTFGFAGLVIDRGTSNNYALLHRESDDTGRYGEFITESDTAQSGAATTITLATTADATDDFYNGMLIKIIGGTGAGQTNTITDYAGATKVATVSAWATNPDSTSNYEIIISDNTLALSLREDTPTDKGVAFWDTTTSKYKTSSNLVFDGTNVGIGTTTAYRNLTVTGSSYPLSVVTTDFVAGSVGSSLLFGFVDNGTDTVSSIQASKTGDTVVTNLILQNSGGNVGIGTNDPISALSNSSDNNTFGTLASDGIYWEINESGYVSMIRNNHITGAGLRIEHKSIGLGVYNLTTSSWEIVTKDGNVGIGTTTPEYMLHQSGTDAGNYGSCFSNFSSTGQGTLIRGGTGTDYNALDVVDKDSNMRFSVRGDGTIVSLATYNSTTAASANMYISSSGQMVRSTSSRKIKTDIKSNVNPSDALKLNPVTFKSKATGLEHMGFIAEEVRGVNPHFANDDKDLPGLEMNAIVAALTSTIQDLNKRIKKLEMNDIPTSK